MGLGSARSWQSTGGPPPSLCLRRVSRTPQSIFSLPTFFAEGQPPCSQLDRQTAPFAKRLKEENRIDHHEAQPKINTSSASRFVPDSSAARNYFGRLPWPVQVLPDSSRYRITPDDFFTALLRAFFATTFPTGLTALATRSLKPRSVPASRTFFFSHIVGLTDPRGRPM